MMTKTSSGEGDGRAVYESNWLSKQSAGCRAFRKLSAQPRATDSMDTASRCYLERIQVDQHGETYSLDVQDISWIEAADNNVILHTTTLAVSLRGRMWALEANLDPLRFRQINRCAIVNIGFCLALEKDARGKAMVMLSDGTCLPVTRQLHELAEAIQATLAIRRGAA